MLNQAVKSLKGEREQETFDTVMDIDLDAYIPASYILNESQKLDIYKRIACIETEEEGAEMLDELIDRFGDPPKSVENLLLDRPFEGAGSSGVPDGDYRKRRGNMFRRIRKGRIGSGADTGTDGKIQSPSDFPIRQEITGFLL